MSGVTAQMVQLPSHFTQPQLSGLKDLVNHHRANGHVVRFDAKEVERIDGVAVQFMVAVSKLQSNIEDLPLLLNPNEVVLKALDDMGVHQQVSMDDVQVWSSRASQNA